jgi:hypothetical protein
MMPAMMLWVLSILLIGVASAGRYLWRRRPLDAMLVLIAAAALAGLAADIRLPASGAVPLTVLGDGLREAEWRDLPARPIAWVRPASGVLRLDFPRRLALGRMFTLTLHRSAPGAARLQLLAENRQVIAEASGSAQSLSVQWLPPAAELLVLRARLQDAAGKTLAEGPVPVEVVDAAPLQVQGRFGAPSFDLRVLGELLVGSGALLDWQITLGKTVTRSEFAPETARAPIASPNLLLVDAAWFERAPDAARSAMLGQVALGTPLVILGANAVDARIWQRTVQLELKPQSDKLAGAQLPMPVAPFNPASPIAGAWSGSDGALWTRRWHEGSITWVGVGDWHRFAISQPRQLGMWWQDVLDQAGVRRDEDVVWDAPDEMPFAGQRLEVCARGVRGLEGEAVFPGLEQSAPWQRRADKADSSCVAVWPKAPGWLKVRTQGSAPTWNDIYVFSNADWPLWQAAQRRDATARYAARTPAPAAASSTPLPAWPLALLFALAMLTLWWRERR